MPKRIQRKRTKGWRMPADAFYVGRPTMFGNPFVVGVDGDAAECLRRYRDYVTCTQSDHLDRGRFVDHQIIIRYLSLYKLRGHDLACWCALDAPCHADVLLEIANA